MVSRTEVEEDRHRLNDVARTAPLRASTTLWASPNRFGRCLSLEVIGARQLPAAKDINLGLQAGNRPVVPIPLLQSQADVAAGGRGRLDEDLLDILHNINRVLDDDCLSPGLWLQGRCNELVCDLGGLDA